MTMSNVCNNVTVVTGGASGIGRACCKVLAEQGYRVVAADIDRAGAEATVSEFDGYGQAVSLDVTREDQWHSMFENISNEGHSITGLVNCAGIGRNGDVTELALEDWNTMLAVNLTGTLLGCQHALRHMQNSGGCIVNIASIGAFVGGADIAGYCATKGGVVALTKALAMHGAPNNIRVCAVAPTYVDSEMLNDVEQNFSSRDEMLKNMAQLVPIGRVAVPDDIANVIAFLLSPGAGMITGSTLYVDGGQLSGLPSRHTS